MKQKPIEFDFPIEQINEIAEREAHAKEKYRPIYFIHKWWARRLGSVFRTIILYTLLDENAKVFKDDGGWRPVTKEELENPWLLYLKDVDFGGKIVLDPMMGGGTTVIEALRLGCKVVAQDLKEDEKHAFQTYLSSGFFPEHIHKAYYGNLVILKM